MRKTCFTCRSGKYEALFEFRVYATRQTMQRALRRRGWTRRQYSHTGAATECPGQHSRDCDVFTLIFNTVDIDVFTSQVSCQVTGHMNHRRLIR